MTPELLSTEIVGVLRDLVDEGALDLAADALPECVIVERPRRPGRGDYATNVALQLAEPAGTSPRGLAAVLAARLEEVDGVAAIEIAGPGFLNVTVETSAQGAVAGRIVAAGPAYGARAVPTGDAGVGLDAVRYAHAHASSILRNAADLGIECSLDGFDPGLLTHEREGDLLRALADPGEPHRVTRYLEDTAAAYHRFYDACRVLPRGEEEVSDLHRARLVLVAATRTVLADGLGLLGVSAPERM